MIGSKLLPRPLRRMLIDNVIGAEDANGLRIYLASLWGLFLLFTLVAVGYTPWAWPAVREAPVESLRPIRCVDINGTSASEDAAPDSSSATKSGNASRAAAAQRARTNETACRQTLEPAMRAELARVDAYVAELQRGGDPQPIEIAATGPARDWIDTHICRLSGADGPDRAALAWYVWQGSPRCGAGDKLVAQLPLSILTWPILGMTVTPIVLLWLLFVLGRHSLRLPSTRRAYRRLYGSEHKAP